MSEIIKWAKAIAIETAALLMMLLSIAVVHWAFNLLLGKDPAIFGGKLPLSYFFDTAHAIAMLRYLFNLVRGFLKLED